MAVYKVITDVEAEDHLLGPLSLKGLIYAGVAAALAFVNFQLLIRTELGAFRFVIVFILAMPMILAGVLASPLGGIQPTEEWLLARIRYYFKAQLRIWDQSGAKQLVTITVPKVEIKHYTKGFSENEVNSRLHALASTLDSRGWAVKNVNVNLYSQPGYLTGEDQQSDRLVTTAALPQDVPTIDIKAEDDILDAGSNPTAQNFDRLVHEKQSEHRQAIKQRVMSSDKPAEQASNFWFMQEPAKPTIEAGEPMSMFGDRPAIEDAELPHAAAESDDDKKVLERIHTTKEREHRYGSTSHLKRIVPASEQAAKELVPDINEASADDHESSSASVTKKPQTDKLGSLAHSELNNEISVDTLSKLANKRPDDKGDDEVVISLHH